jgi:ubiquinone/menaquinone biosynthesis C-methylase UbiE
MDDRELLIDLHRDGRRQGPGSEADTLRALDLSGIDRQIPLVMADIGCGTGASTLVLAKALDAQITAVDFLQDFLDELDRRAREAGLADHISTLECSMETLPFDEQSLDLIWSEGAIYNIGFEQGVRDRRPFLKEGGVLVASEREEIQLYERFQDCFSYGVYVARKTGPGDSA